MFPDYFQWIAIAGPEIDIKCMCYAQKEVSNAKNKYVTGKTTIKWVSNSL